MLNNLGMGIIFTASDFASHTIQNIARKFGDLDVTLSALQERFRKDNFIGPLSPIKGVGEAVGKGMKIAAVGVAGLTAAFAAANSAGDYEYRLKELQTTAGLTGEQVEELRTKFKRLDQLDTFRTLQAASIDAADAMRGVVAVTDLARGSFGRLNEKQVADMVGVMVNNFKELKGDPVKAADALAKAIQGLGFQAEELPGALEAAKVGTQLLNASMSDTLPVIALIKDRVGSASEAAMGMQRVMMRLSAAKTEGKLGDLAEVIDTNTGKMRPFLNILSDIAMRVKDLGETEGTNELEKAFGVRSLKYVKPLMEEIQKKAKEAGGGVLGYRKAVEQLRNNLNSSTATAAALAEKQRETWDGLKQTIGEALSDLKTEVGMAFLQTLLPVLKLVQRGVTFVRDAFVALPEPVKKGMAFVFVLGSAATVVAGVSMAVAALLPFLKLLAIHLGLIALPFIKVIAVVALVTAAIYAMKLAWENNFGGVRDKVLPILERVQLAFLSLKELLSEGVLKGDLAEKLVADKPLFRFVDVVSQVVALVRAYVGGMFDAWKDAFSEIYDIGQATFGDLLDAIGAVVREVVAVVKPALALFGIEWKDNTEGLIGVVKTLAYWLTKLSLQPFLNMIRVSSVVIRSILGIIRTGSNFAASIFEWGAAIWQFAKGVVGVALEWVRSKWEWLKGMIYALVKPWIDAVAGPLDTIMGSYIDPFVAYVKGVWHSIASVVVTVWTAIKTTILNAINAVIDQMNGLVDRAVTLANKVPGGEALAQKLGGLKLEHIVAAAEAAPGPGVGASATTTASVGASSGPTLTVPSSAGSVTVAQSAPPPGESRALTDEDIQRLTEALIKAGATQRGNPIRIESTLNLDGREVAKSQASAQREDESRNGRLAAPWGR